MNGRIVGAAARHRTLLSAAASGRALDSQRQQRALRVNLGRPQQFELWALEAVIRGTDVIQSWLNFGDARSLKRPILQTCLLSAVSMATMVAMILFT